jgi:hypothetical protein
MPPPRPHQRIAKTLTTEVHHNQLPYRLPKTDVPGWNSPSMLHATPSCPPPWRLVPPCASPMTEQGGIHHRSTVHATTPTIEVAAATTPRGPTPPLKKQMLSNITPPPRELPNLSVDDLNQCLSINRLPPGPRERGSRNHQHYPPR